MFRKRHHTDSGTPRSEHISTGSKKKKRVVDCSKILLDVAKESADWFPPLKAALGGVNALINHYEKYADVKEKVQELVPLLERFRRNITTATAEGDPEETSRREGLASAFGEIEGLSQKLLAKSPIARFADKSEDSKVVAGIVERLREAIGCYQISQQQSIYTQITHLTSSFGALLELREKPPVLRHKVESVVAQLNRLEDSPWKGRQHEHWTSLLDDIRPIRDKAKELHEHISAEEYVEDERDIAAISTLAEDLRDVLLEYWMTQQQEVYDQNCKLIDKAELSVLNGCRRAQGAEYCHGNRRGCLKGTRTTVLDEIDSWAKDFSESPVFWLNGLAGTGKSTIAQTIAERLFAEDRLGASFFCSRDFEDRSNLHFIFPTLAFQLAHKYPDFRSRFVSLLQSSPDIVHESLFRQMQRLIVELLRATDISTIIIIDALDECKDDEPSSTILSVLGRFVEQVPKVKFFITGRPEPRIKTGFRLPLLVDSTDIFVLHDVHPSLINGDIRLFLRHELSELAQRRDLERWPSDEHINLLCHRAAGLFIYAVATVKFLDSSTRLPEHQLGVILELPESTAPEGRTRFKHKTTLDSLYMSILQTAFDEEDRITDYKVRVTIGTIIFLANPLPPPAIAELNILDIREVILFLTLIQSLLAMSGDFSQPVKPFHKSFPDFITDPSRCIDPRFYIPPQHLHLHLVTNCLRAMNENLERNLLSLPEYALNSEVQDLRARINGQISVALQYSCRSWFKHLTNVRGDDCGILFPLRTFLSTKFLAWLEVLSVLGDLGEAVVALETVITWLQELKRDDWLEAVARDFHFFVTKFFEPINVSATHIYHSALELCPERSFIRKLYYPQCDRIVQSPRVVVGVPDSWDLTISSSSKNHDYKFCTWSPCGRFVSAQMGNVIEIRNHLTFELITTLQPTETSSRLLGPLVYSPDGHSLACVSTTAVVIWDIKTGGVAREIGCGGGSTSLVWLLDGTKICVIGGCGDTSAVQTIDIATGTTMSTGELRSDDDPRLWADEESFHVITTARSASIITIFKIGTEISSVQSFHLQLYPTTRPETWLEISFSPTTKHVSISTRTTLRIFGDWGSWPLLDVRESFSFHCFSSDGRMFGAFRKGSFHVWRASERVAYSLWEEFKCLDCTRPSFQFSPTSSSILGCSGIILQMRRLTGHTVGPAAIPRFAGIFPFGNQIAVVRQGDRTLDIISPHSRTPFQVLDMGSGIEGLAVTGNILLVGFQNRVAAWLLEGRGSLDGTSAGDVHASQNIWTTQEYSFVTLNSLRIEGSTGQIALNSGSVCYNYDTQTGEFLWEWQVPQRFSSSWSLFECSLRGRDHPLCHSWPHSETPPESDWRTSRVELIEGWIKDPEGRHRLWIPVEWRTSWDPADWIHDLGIQFSFIGDEPVIVKF